MLEREVLVLGGGPAGAACAIGLRRLGHAVTVVDEARRFRAVEGVSERVLDGLRQAGFRHALQAVAEPSARTVTWNGERSAANTERLVDRARFDALLRKDLAEAGVECVDARVLRCGRQGGAHFVELAGEGGRVGMRAVFLVEARGRSAPYGTGGRVRGAETVSLLQYWQGPALTAQSAVESFEDGWAWLAAMPDGMRYLQLTLDVASTRLPDKAALAGFCTSRLRALEAAAPFLADALPVGQPQARSSTPVCAQELAGMDWLRVGDAAMAVDPLSGNGIFQALSSALQAPAVINTLLRRPEDADQAIAFHHARVAHLFLRFARIGRDFYAGERRWAQQPFWQSRAVWPDALPVHGETRPEAVRIERRPVVSWGYIEMAEVVVTPDQPLGVWQVDGVEVAPVLRALRTRQASATDEGARVGAEATPPPGLPAERVAALAAWMRARNWL